MAARTSFARRGVLAIALGCALSFGVFQVAARAYAVPSGDFPVDGRYAGVLVCSDCAGVWTQLILVDPSAGGLGSGTFVMTERFTGGIHKGATVTTHGSWSIKFESEPFTGKLELRPESAQGKPSPTRYFYCDHGRSLEMLDVRGLGVSPREGNLQRVIPPPRPNFGPLMAANSGAAIFGAVGDTFAVDLPASENTWDSAWILAKPASSHVALVYLDGTSLPPASGLFSEFILKAVSPGKARVTFRNAADPTKNVSFSFVIAR